MVNVAGRSRTRDRHVKCPRGNYHYRCADGRRKCKRCGKLFNHRPRGRRNEPPPENRSEITRLLRLGLPAARVILPKRCDGKHLVGAILENVELDSIVYSDGWKAYNKLSLNGFHHKRINHDKTLVDGKVHINGPESSRGYAKSLQRRLQTQRQALYQRKAAQIQPSRRRNLSHYLQDALLNWSDQVI